MGPEASATGTTSGPVGDPRRQRWRGTALSLGVLIAVFGIAIPQITDYDDAWAAIVEISPYWGVLLATTVGWNLYTYWPVLTAALPGLRTREAAVVQQASTAVANTVPAGGALGMAVTYRFLRAWGFTSQAVARQLVGINFASLLVKLLMPVVALVLVASTGEVSGTYLWLAVVGVVGAAAAALTLVVALRDDGTTRRAGASVDRLARRSPPLRRRVADDRITTWLLGLRHELLAMARDHGLRLLAVTVVSHTSLFVVLLVALRAVGVGGSDVDWAIVFAGFAFVRLLSALPITPGGSGIVELGYVGLLVAEAPGLAAEITAAVLLFRALTFLLPIGLGGLAWLAFRSTASWRAEPDTRGHLAPT